MLEKFIAGGGRTLLSGHGGQILGELSRVAEHGGDREPFAGVTLPADPGNRRRLSHPSFLEFVRVAEAHLDATDYVID